MRPPHRGERSLERSDVVYKNDGAYRSARYRAWEDGKAPKSGDPGAWGKGVRYDDFHPIFFLFARSHGDDPREMQGLEGTPKEAMGYEMQRFENGGVCSVVGEVREGGSTDEGSIKARVYKTVFASSNFLNISIINSQRLIHTQDTQYTFLLQSNISSYYHKHEVRCHHHCHHRPRGFHLSPGH